MSPFFLDPSDVLVRAVPHSPRIRHFVAETWVNFVADLNSALRHLDSTHLEATLPYVLRHLAAWKATHGADALGGLSVELGRFWSGSARAPVGSSSGGFAVRHRDEFRLGLLLLFADDGVKGSGSNASQVAGDGSVTSLVPPPPPPTTSPVRGEVGSHSSAASPARGVEVPAEAAIAGGSDQTRARVQSDAAVSLGSGGEMGSRRCAASVFTRVRPLPVFFVHSQCQ
jgi:hypothetical protein